MNNWRWTIPGVLDISFSGYREFRDVQEPLPGKDEWGVDTLERVIRGPGSDFAAYSANLHQGDIYASPRGNFYLQSWRPLPHYIFPGFALQYKGFTTGQLPDPLPSTARTELISSLTADGLSVSWRGKVIVSATQERRYLSPSTTYRYLLQGEPTGTRFTNASQVRGSGITDLETHATVTFDDGTTTPISGNLPAGVATALFVTPVVFNPGPNFSPIVGTPWYEVEETVQLKYRV